MIAPDLGDVSPHDLTEPEVSMTQPIAHRRSRLRNSVTDAGRQRQKDRARHLCRSHAGQLLTMATLMLNDTDTACDVVSDSIAAACRPGRDIDPLRDHARADLAASVYRRCLGVLASRERFKWLPNTPAGAMPFARLNANQRAAIALTLFGGHNLTQAATTMNQSEVTILDQLTDLLGTFTGRAAATHRAEVSA
jgi:hypothetical protein